MKTTVIIMSVLSILDLIVAISLGAWIHSNGKVVVDGTNLLEIHIIQGIGAAILTSITLSLILIWRKKKKRILMIIASLLSMIGFAFSLLSGWFVYKHVGIIVTIARLYHFHGIQAISTATLTIAILLLAALSGGKKPMQLSNAGYTITDENEKNS